MDRDFIDVTWCVYCVSLILHLISYNIFKKISPESTTIHSIGPAIPLISILFPTMWFFIGFRTALLATSVHCLLVITHYGWKWTSQKIIYVPIRQRRPRVTRHSHTTYHCCEYVN